MERYIHIDLNIGTAECLITHNYEDVDCAIRQLHNAINHLELEKLKYPPTRTNKMQNFVVADIVRTLHDALPDECIEGYGEV